MKGRVKVEGHPIFNHPLPTVICFDTLLCNMRCSHRDHGGRRWSLCLKHSRSDKGIRDCDLNNMEFCEDRSTDEEIRRLNDSFIDSVCRPCAYCGREHRSVRQHLACGRIHCAEGIIEGVDSEFPESTARLRISTWARIRGMVLERDSYTCLSCGTDLSSRPEWMREVHHILPRTMGGTDDPRNLRTLCNACHRPLTEILLLSMEPKDDEGRKEAELRRKFRNGRELLRSLSTDPDA